MEDSCSCSASGGLVPIAIQLTDQDIDGACLDLSKLSTFTTRELRWWLLCRGINPPSGWNKPKLIEKIQFVSGSDMPIIDVDGYQLYRKQQKLESEGVHTLPLPLPGIPVAEWKVVNASNYKDNNIPVLTQGSLYTYLSKGCERTTGHGAFRALNRGYIHWSSGRLGSIEMNFKHPQYCHVKCTTTPSMKIGKYIVYILLQRNGNLGDIVKATCDCAAGESASCTHVSALLHALASMCAADIQCQHYQSEEDDDVSSAVPITSLICQWVKPRRRKESNAKISETEFLKHVYGRTVKHELKPISCFDPRPIEKKEDVSTLIAPYLEKMKGLGIGISMLLDSSMQVWSDPDLSSVDLPSVADLKKSVQEFITSLHVSPEKIREIERNTKLQSQSSSWYFARKYRLTASMFGEVFRRKETTPPDSLVLRVIDPKQFSSHAVNWGKTHESIALEKYEVRLKSLGNLESTVCKAGFVISETNPYLGASPDSYVYDPSRTNKFGLVEVKCPYKYRNMSAQQACLASDFCAELDSHNNMKLKHSHPYYCQVQGQMAITGRLWCDFLVYTTKGIDVDTVEFDEDFWNLKLFPSLDNFYRNCIAPEIVSPIHCIGLPVRDLSKQ